MAQCRTKLPEISAGAGLSGVFDYGGRGHLLGLDPEHFRDGRRVRRNLAGNGLYGAAVLLPVQNGQYGKGRVQRSLTEGLPIGTYNIIYADPPWRYEQRKVQGAAENHYYKTVLQEQEKNLE